MLKTYLAVGDSYTIGEGVAEPERWPMRLSARLRQTGFAIENPRIIAKTGWTTVDLYSAIGRERLSVQFDVVTLLAGVNDQFRGLGVVAYRRSFDRLLRQTSRLAKLPSHLIVLSIPDWSVTPFATGRDRTSIAREIDAFNDANRSAAASNGSRYVDVTAASREALSTDGLLAADGLHPSAAMYERWVELLFPIVRDLLIARSSTTTE